MEKFDLDAFHNLYDTKINLNEEKSIFGYKYDLVSYFNSEEPRKGSDKYIGENDGRKYYFNSQENLDIFNGNPGRYLPKYGGWCAMGMALSGCEVGTTDLKPGKYPVNCNTYKIINNELYLFFNFDGTNAIELWETDEKRYLEEAELLWEIVEEITE